MLLKYRHRKTIQYGLIVLTLLIQICLIIFFYNEYFNGNKLKAIESKLLQSQQWSQTSQSSNFHLFNAQQHLNNYVQSPQKTHLEAYFNEIKQILLLQDSAVQHRDTIFSEVETIVLKHDNLETIARLEKLLDSVYRNPPKLDATLIPIQVNPISVKTEMPSVEVASEVVKDSSPPKKFVQRLKDAFQGNVNKQVDTVYITTRYQQLIDTVKLKENIDSTLQDVNAQYEQTLQKYQQQLVKVSAANSRLFHIYNQLLQLSHEIINSYDENTNAINAQLYNTYQSQIDRQSNIRKYSVLTLLVLSTLVIVMMFYLIKLSFQYEKDLTAANEAIAHNLSFKNRIIGMLSHEVRAPLNIINLFVRKLLKRSTDNQMTQQLSSILFTNDSLLLQANQILTLTKYEHKVDMVEMTAFDINEELKHIYNMFEPYVRHAGNTLTYMYDIPNPSIIISDRIKLHQLLINLLSNANKFTPQGNIFLEASLKALDDGFADLKLIISDEGMGIPASDIEQIFEPYFQSKDDKINNNLGAGLGLYLCKDIVLLLGGSIQVQSTEGSGTRIQIDLKVKLQHD